jgi:Protein of unknown function (DUF2510)
MSSPPAGWYPDPESPDSGRARYWDGERWTDEYREPRGREGDVAIAVLGSLLLGSGALVRALDTREDEGLEDAEMAGYIVGGILGPILILLAIRFIYVRLFKRSAPAWSPWILVAAGAFAWLAAAGQLGRD